jgi:hypothetical protein
LKWLKSKWTFQRKFNNPERAPGPPTGICGLAQNSYVNASRGNSVLICPSGTGDQPAQVVAGKAIKATEETKLVR